MVVDDDEVFRQVLVKAFLNRGYLSECAADSDSALELAVQFKPEYAVVDLIMPGDSGLVLVQALRRLDPQMKILMLTGYASISTAVEAVKLGATNYLPKPADADEILAALDKTSADAGMELEQKPLSPRRLEWEYINKVLAENGGNVSATARALNMHRRTLQRKLAKHPVKE
ncbi:MAG: response regulator transcription factor [Pseudomonadales bacterium]|nr:response regulator transcription factor [Pseudomonadales bacterium]